MGIKACLKLCGLGRMACERPTVVDSCTCCAGRTWVGIELCLHLGGLVRVACELPASHLHSMAGSQPGLRGSSVLQLLLLHVRAGMQPVCMVSDCLEATDVSKVSIKVELI